MAEIPTYTATLAAARGQRGQVQAELGSSALLPGQAAKNLGEEIQHAGLTLEHIAEVQKQREREQNIKWATDANDSLSRELIPWQQENQNREDYGDAYRKFADEKLANYLKDAPNPRAADILKAHAMPAINSDWAGALKQGEHNRQTNFKASEIKASNGYNEAFRFRYQADPEAAKDVYSHDVAMQSDRIEATYGKLAPLTAAAMKETAGISSVLGVLDTDPAFARELLNANRNIDAQSRSVLLNKIETAEMEAHRLDATRFTIELQNQYKNSVDAGIKIAIPPKSAFGVYGKSADEKYEVFSSEAKKQNQFVDEWQATKSWAPHYQAEKVSDLMKKGEGELAHKLYTKAEQAQQDISRGNSAGHILKNYDDVAALFTAANQAVDPKDRADKLQQGYSRILMYSGAAPLFVSEAESKKFLGQSTGQSHILSTDNANARGAELNGMSPQDLMMAIKAMPQQYGNERYAAIAFNDLATLPHEGNRLTAAMQFAGAMPSPELAIKFLGVVKNTKDIKPLPDATVREFRDYLYGSTDGVWNAFRRTFNGDSNQRAALLDDFENSVLKYAYQLNGEGLKPKAAVQKAVQHTVSDSFGFADINGTPMLIMKQRGDGKPLRTDAEISTMGRRMSVALRDFPLQELNTKDALGREIWPQAQAIQDPVRRLQYVRDAITSRGFFVTEADGQSATVYVADESGKGTMQQLRDKNNQPFEIAFDDLPQFMLMMPELPYVPFAMNAPAAGGAQHQVPILPTKTYELKGQKVEKMTLEGWRKAEENEPLGGLLYPFQFYRSAPVTNWPTPGTYYKRQAPPR